MKMLKHEVIASALDNGAKNKGVRLNIPGAIADLMDINPRDEVKLELQIKSINDVQLVITKVKK